MSLILRLPEPDPALRLKIKTGNKTIFVKLSEILYCRAHRNYTCIHTVNGEKYILAITLLRMQKNLAPQGFAYISKYCIVNTAHINSICHNGKTEITLSNNEKLEVSRRRKTKLGL